MQLLEAKNALLTSLVKSLDEIDESWRNYPGLLIPGSWLGQDDEEFIQEAIPKIKSAKADRMPFLGLCLGLQALGIAEGGELVKLPENRQGIRPIKGWWGETQESHWHRFKVIGNFPGYDVYETDGIIETMMLKDHPFFVGLQWH